MKPIHSILYIILDYMNGKGKEGFTRFCNVVNILAREGARVRESEGFPRPAMPEQEKLLTCLQPIDNAFFLAANGILVEVHRQSCHCLGEDVNTGIHGCHQHGRVFRTTFSEVLLPR